MNTSTRNGIVILVIILAVIIGAAIWMHGPSTENSEGRLISSVAYACNEGKTIQASYFQGIDRPAAGPDQPPVPGGSVEVKLSDGRDLTLAQTISADGVRYANADESLVFWSKGNGALVLENNEEKSYIGCVATAPQPAEWQQSAAYSPEGGAFSLRLPSLVVSTSSASASRSDAYVADEKYHYQALGPGKDIWGVKFTIPASMATGTNLAGDSYISVEQIFQAPTCSAGLFVSPGARVAEATEGNTTYSVASTSEAAAGNRYEETVYAIPGTNPCIAVRYFIHYGAFENYPAGAVKQFDRQALMSEFDAIRRTLVVN